MKQDLNQESKPVIVIELFEPVVYHLHISSLLLLLLFWTAMDVMQSELLQSIIA